MISDRDLYHYLQKRMQIKIIVIKLWLSIVFLQILHKWCSSTVFISHFGKVAMATSIVGPGFSLCLTPVLHYDRAYRGSYCFDSAINYVRGLKYVACGPHVANQFIFCLLSFFNYDDRQKFLI
jgi:hypothetical protein